MTEPKSSNISRRSFLATAAALGAAAAWAAPEAHRSGMRWTERRDAYPEGVASGDPFPESVILWTRYPSSGVATLTVEVAEDEDFTRVIILCRRATRVGLDLSCPGGRP
jgi:alkaline phosphatase D